MGQTLPQAQCQRCAPGKGDPGASERAATASGAAGGRARTAFQCRVWEALRAIPYGSTRSYRAVAEALGQPTAARAVARACATNPVALVIPCHRVIGEDGELRGYRWGTERKRELLDQDRG